MVTLYDFDAGVNDPSSVVVAPADFTVTIQNVGVTPVPGSGTITPVDSAAIANISFTYTGTTIRTDATFVVTITLNGNYTTRLGQYASQNSFPAAPGGTNTQIDAVFLPTAAAIPEPTSVVLLGLGGVPLFLLRRRIVKAAV
nr:PEP-CTERM sorting domain-containing protein [Paludisphaera mucosa]